MSHHSIPSSLVNDYVLHTAASAGDEEGVRAAIHAGVDVNQLDQFGRSALMRAVGGDDWDNISSSDKNFMSTRRMNTIRALLDTDMSLLTLNGPQSCAHGVTVLSLAAWLNMYPVVELLLQESSGRVCVDGMDSHGATALMYAARDNSIDVSSLLLQHGARPDYRDCGHRSVIQHALPHPYLLYLCEQSLKWHRLQESIKSSRSKLAVPDANLLSAAEASLRSTKERVITPSFEFAPSSEIVEAIRLDDLTRLRSLLFPASISSPSLINHPDAKGWSPIHHCLSCKIPSIQVLDALYLAGADVSLFTTGDSHSPLHLFALSRPSVNVSEDDIFRFLRHLVLDLRAPLATKDKDDETCIHLAAEHGDARVLSALLKLDDNGAVRDIRNARGLTALEVTKNEFRVLFGEAEVFRSSSVLSHFTIRASPSITSLASMADWASYEEDAPSSPIMQDSPFANPTEALLHHLASTTLPPPTGTDASDFPAALEASIRESSRLSRTVLEKSKKRTSNIQVDLEELRRSLRGVASLHEAVSTASKTKCSERNIVPVDPMGVPRQSEDSEKTLVNRSRSSSLVQQDSASQTTEVDGLGLKKNRSNTSLALTDGRASKMSKHTRSSAAIDVKFGTAKLRSWLKQKMAPLEIFSGMSARMGDEHHPARTGTPVHPSQGREARQPVASILKRPSMKLSSSDEALRTSLVVLHAVERDIAAISACLDSCNTLIKKASGYISRTDRVIQRVLKSRRAYLDIVKLTSSLSVGHKSSISESLAMAAKTSPSDAHYSPANAPTTPKSPTLSLSPSISSLSSTTSTILSRRSSAISVASNNTAISNATATKRTQDDEDIRLVRRLLKRKVEASIDGVLDEMEVALKWTRVVKEVLRSLKRKAHLST